MKFIMLESHPNDSRIKVDNSGTCQSLTGRMGTGGGNVPIIIFYERDTDPGFQLESDHCESKRQQPHMGDLATPYHRTQEGR